MEPPTSPLRSSSVRRRFPPLLGEKKTERLMIRLTTDEKHLIDAAAIANKTPTATWVRDLVLSAAHAAVTKKKPAKKKQ